jgi:hypothetical protein
MTWFAKPMRLKRLTGNKKDNLTIIYTPADNLKVSKRLQKIPLPSVDALF